MQHVVRGLVSAVLGLFVGFSVASLVSLDPTGLVPIVLGLGLAVVSTAAFYAGIGKATATEPE